MSTLTNKRSSSDTITLKKKKKQRKNERRGLKNIRNPPSTPGEWLTLDDPSNPINWVMYRNKVVIKTVGGTEVAALHKGVISNDNVTTMFNCTKQFFESVLPKSNTTALGKQTIIDNINPATYKSEIKITNNKIIKPTKVKAVGRHWCGNRQNYAIHAGNWRKNNVKIVSISSSNYTDEMKIYLRDSNPFHDNVSTWFEQTYPHQSKQVQIIKQKITPEETVMPQKDLLAWSANQGGSRGLHLDKSDNQQIGAIITAVGASTWIICEGIRCMFYLEPGDILKLRGDIIYHKAAEWIGERYSFSYFFDDNCFKIALPKENV